MNTKPIGLFDSGVGGTSIWKEIRALLPFENTLYLADSKNAPYGTQSQEKIIELSIKNTQYLVNKGCKIIVIACNTATTNAIDILRAQFNVPIIGIEPAIKPAALKTQTKAIGILATKGTLSSALFHKTTNLYASDISIVERVGEGLVSLIEEGKMNSLEMTELLKLYTKPMVDSNIDYLVLGCTHYPYLIPQLLKLLPKKVSIIDSGLAVARHTKATLESNNLINNENTIGKNLFYINTNNTQTMSSLLGKNRKVEYLDF
ncbi:glutamate racemase [Bizionia saleffrena]|uniref:Glutamate racemase n=1 Tax=Bizionia saleffrena TaxID=291189 RepID=A0A8H2LCC5_9FLAO|nr:glutamate racemase [Bizionia saleffrena]TYB73979.1 glutamate racemase [Bizionia saleffrena]